MTRDKLPPLTALRAFDAAARHMSFRDAAAELNVTPAALSFQIKSLEEQLGFPVFNRLNRMVELTPAGHVLFPGTRDAFLALGAAWRSAQRINDTRAISVTADPTFASWWLAPQLYDFAEQNRDIDLRLNASYATADLSLVKADVAIRFLDSAPADHFAEPLFCDWVTPVMNANMAKIYDSPAKLASAPLICIDDENSAEGDCHWPAWLRQASLPIHSFTPVAATHIDHAIELAIAGSGILLGRVSLTQRALADGRLVAPFTLGLQARLQPWLVSRIGAETLPQVVAFRTWLSQKRAAIEDLQHLRKIVPPIVPADDQAHDQPKDPRKGLRATQTT